MSVVLPTASISLQGPNGRDVPEANIAREAHAFR